MNADARDPASHPHPAPQRDRLGNWWLWSSLVLPPAVWFLQMTIDAVLTGQACYPGDVPLQQPRIDVAPIVVGCDVVVAIIAILGGVIGWRNWRRTAAEKAGGGHHLLESGDGRTRFMAMCGMLTSALVLVASLYALFAHLSVAWCGT